MPLTKVRYDMLDAEVTTRITQQVNLTGAGSPFVFTATNDGNTETLTKFKVDSVEKTIRNTEITGNKLVITLASFTPTLTASGQTLNWDQEATTFNVTADNPTADYPDQWISDVKTPLAQVSGSITTDLSKFTKSGTSLPLSASADINTTFTVANDGYIRPVHADVSGTANGGTASATVTFKNNTTGGSPADWTETKTWTTNWANVSHSISNAALSGHTFLQTYASTTFTITTSGLSDLTKANCTLTATGGSATSPGTSGTRTGTFTFTAPIHKSNVGTTRKLSLNTVFTRPASVTGTEYTYTPSDTETAATVSASFTYPSFTAWTAGTATVPTRGDCVAVDALDTSFVTVLGNQANSLSAMVTNSENVPRAFWFAVRSAASQPSSFKTGTGPGLLSDVSATEATVNLSPDTPPGDYAAEAYKLYGIVLQSGDTYVSIS